MKWPTQRTHTCHCAVLMSKAPATADPGAGVASESSLRRVEAALPARGSLAPLLHAFGLLSDAELEREEQGSRAAAGERTKPRQQSVGFQAQALECNVHVCGCGCNHLAGGRRQSPGRWQCPGRRQAAGRQPSGVAPWLHGRRALPIELLCGLNCHIDWVWDWDWTVMLIPLTLLQAAGSRTTAC